MGLLASDGQAGGFNPRPPCGGRHPLAERLYRLVKVSIRALPAEGDLGFADYAADPEVSIRALPAEGDQEELGKAAGLSRFNPRPPCGGRPAEHHSQSAGVVAVSIRALPAEGDRSILFDCQRTPYQPICANQGPALLPASHGLGTNARLYCKNEHLQDMRTTRAARVRYRFAQALDDEWPIGVVRNLAAYMFNT